MTTQPRRRFLQQLSGAGLAALGVRPIAARSATPQLKVGVVYVSPIADIGWTRQHELGRLAMEAAFNGRVSSTRVENVSQPLDAERVFRDLVAKDHQLIFGTSFSHTQPMLKVASQMSEARFESCAGAHTTSNLGTFEARYYEGTYLAGVVAARKTKSNVLGFIGGFPVPDVVGPANALLLGARSVNPKIVCKTIWLNSWYDPGKEKEAARTLIALGADVLVSMTDTPTTVQLGEEAGVSTIGYASDMSKYGPRTNLTSFVLDWSSIYIGAARGMLDKDWVPTHRWDGLKAGVVKMAPYNASLPADAVNQVNAVQQQIADGRLHPFAGPIKDQSGKLRVPAGKVLDDDAIRGINWFVEGMQGNLG